LCKAIYYNETDYLEQPDIADPSTLLYQRLFPHDYIPIIQDEMKTYVTLQLTEFTPVGQSFKSGFVQFHIFAHQDLFRTDYGELRTDYIVRKIDQLLNQSDEVGIGVLQFHAMNPYRLNESYSGYVLMYKTYEFN